MNLYIITEHRVDNLVELMGIVDLCIESQFLSLGSLGLNIVLPEESLLPPGP